MMRISILLVFLCLACAPPSRVAVVRVAAPCPRCPEPAQVPPAANPRPSPPAKPPEPKLALKAVGFDNLPGWSDDAVDQAIPALTKSCKKFLRRKDSKRIGRSGIAGTVGDWRPLCTALRKIPAGDTHAARVFFETYFVPHLASNNGDPIGRFTGYYEALVRASKVRTGKYKWPLYKRPPELVMVYLADWRDKPSPRRVAGRVAGGRLRPYYTRAEIAKGALKGRKLELYWADDVVDVVFAQVQGSGVVELPDGTRRRIHYAGQNGHIYTAIGRILIRWNEVVSKDMSMQAIRAWCQANPKRVRELLNHNKAFVFFEDSKKPGAVGAQGIVLTPERSIAIDRRFIPLGMPVFIDTEVPTPENGDAPTPWRKLTVAQDTGGAIRGPVRADLFMGAGKRAYSIAGRIRAKGRYYLLIPLTVVQKTQGTSTPTAQQSNK